MKTVTDAVDLILAPGSKFTGEFYKAETRPPWLNAFHYRSVH